MRNYLEAHGTSDFELYPTLVLHVTCEFRRVIETTLHEFAREQRDKTFYRWLKAKGKSRRVFLHHDNAKDYTE